MQSETVSTPMPGSSQGASPSPLPVSSLPELPASQSPIPSPTQQNSRPTTPGVQQPLHIRHPSSSFSFGSSSRRTSLLTPPDSSLPLRLPRQPSQQDVRALTELHQELETEQEAQVNRLLNMIRQQQLQYHQTDDNSSTAATIDSASTTTGRARSPVSSASISRRASGRLSRENSARHRSRSRASSSHTSSPSFPAQNLGDNASESSVGGPWLPLSHSDIGHYIAETQMLTRENEMLKRRIRELEKQIAELNMKDTSATESVPKEQQAAVTPEGAQGKAEASPGGENAVEEQPKV